MSGEGKVVLLWKLQSETCGALDLPADLRSYSHPGWVMAKITGSVID